MNAIFRNRLTRPALVTAALLFVLTVSSIVLVPADAVACEEEWWQTFYAEPEHVNVVGECWRPCYGWASCWGSRSDYYTFASWSCGPCGP